MPPGAVSAEVVVPPPDFVALAPEFIKELQAGLFSRPAAKVKAARLDATLALKLELGMSWTEIDKLVVISGPLATVMGVQGSLFASSAEGKKALSRFEEDWPPQDNSATVKVDSQDFEAGDTRPAVLFSVLQIVQTMWACMIIRAVMWPLAFPEHPGLHWVFSIDACNGAPTARPFGGALLISTRY